MSLKFPAPLTAIAEWSCRTISTGTDPKMVRRGRTGYSWGMKQDVIEVLSEDHAAVQALFVRVSQPDEDRPAVLGQLLRALSAHVAAEKQLVVPVLLEHSDKGKVLANRLRDDHDAIEKLVILVERRKVNSPDVPDLVTDLLEITKSHAGQADEHLLPFLRDQLSPVELADLGAAMRSDELQLTSHPHPHLPDTGPLANVIRRAAALVDRGRDSSTDLRRPGL
jgi:Hemerythrin HHE cation binding domain